MDQILRRVIIRPPPAVVDQRNPGQIGLELYSGLNLFHLILGCNIKQLNAKVLTCYVFI